MFYQVRANILFSIEDEAVDFYYDCQIALPKGAVINPDQPNMEWSHIELLKNHHDTNPNQPCDVIASEDNKP